MSYPESHFLHQRDPQLHTSGPVGLAVNSAKQAGERIPNEPPHKINAYLGSLARHSLIAEIPEDDPIKASKLLQRRKKQIEARVIKPGAIPDNFWQTQVRAARELGHGDIEVTDELIQEATRVLQTDQRESLRDWVDYLADKDSNYPTWFKYFVLSGVTKLADYDKDKGQFPRRSKSTTDPFPGLNREALAYVYDKLGNHLDDKEPDNAELAQLLEHANFAKLYAHSLAEIGFADPELLKERRGSWAKYDQSENPTDIRRLSDSLKGYGTGWCTAGEGYARTQLAAGDFYVFYSKDKDGIDRVPRVAIRMEDGQVAEVRGIIGGGQNAGPAENNRQELEVEMIDIAMAKLKDLPGGEAYTQKADDMRRLTELERRLKMAPQAPLSHAELSFLYEIDHQIQGFGYDRDPRIDEIRSGRGKLDYPELKNLLRENLPQQIEASLHAANVVIDQLNALGGRHEQLVPLHRAEIEKILGSKLEEWAGNGSLEWCVEQMVENGGRLSLLATPNVLATPEQIISLAKNFGQEQPHETYVYDELYGQYSAEELSGPLVIDANVKLSLIPSASDKKLYGDVQRQRATFQDQRNANPSLRVPSVLEAITYWQTLRASGDKLDDYGAFDKTYIRHFDLPEQRFGDWSCVPFSYVSYDGKPDLYYSDAENDHYGRLAVG